MEKKTKIPGLVEALEGAQIAGKPSEDEEKTLEKGFRMRAIQRKEREKRVQHVLRLGYGYLIALCVFSILLVRTWHYVAEGSRRWLTEGQIATIDTILVWIIAIAVVNKLLNIAMNRYKKKEKDGQEGT